MADAFEETQKLFNEWKQIVRDSAEIDIEKVRNALNACDSPIEQLFLSTYIANYQPSINWGDRLLTKQETLWGRIQLLPQHSISLPDLKCRVDFFFIGMSSQHVERLVVEIDGHDFHERTKEQAERDKHRDRVLLREGYHVFRFTGSEVFRDAEKAVNSVIEYLERKCGAVAA